MKFRFFALLVLVAVGLRAEAAPDRSSHREGWKILERIRKLSGSIPEAPGSAELSARRDALVAELERLGWRTRTVETGLSDEMTGNARLGAVVAERGSPTSETVVLVARLPVGALEESRHLALSGAAVLLDVAAELENTQPRHLWRLVLVDSDGRDDSAAEREAVRGRKERITAVVAVDRVGRGAPLVAIPFPAPGAPKRRGVPPRASTLEVLGHLEQAAKSEGISVHEGDAGQEPIFLVASRLLGMSLRSPAIPFAEQGAPTLLLTDASPSEFRPSEAAAEIGTRPQQSAEIDPESLRAVSDLLRSFLLRADAAPPAVVRDEVVRFRGRRFELDDLRNGLLGLLALSLLRLFAHRRKRPSAPIEAVRLAGLLLYAAGVAVTAFESPVGAVFLYGASVAFVLLLPPGRVWALFVELVAILVPLARLAFYLEVQVGGSGAFRNGSAAYLLRQPALALVVVGLVSATAAAGYLRFQGSGSDRSKPDSAE